MGGRSWTQDQLLVLRIHYPDTRTDQLAAKLGRSIMCTKKMAQRIGVRKSDAYISRVRSDALESAAEDNPFKRKHLQAINRTPTYKIWVGMRNRCKPSGVSSKNHGVRGIRVCERWQSFEAFLEDMGPRPPGMSIGRIDNDGNYEPSNCRWENGIQQARNTRVNRLVYAFGSTKTLAEWSELSGINYCTILSRLKRGMCADEALTKPPAMTRPDVQVAAENERLMKSKNGKGLMLWRVRVER